MSTETCIFCKIATKQIPSNIVYEDDLALAFHDLNPEAPVHVLVIPKLHVTNIAEASDEHKSLLGHLMLAAKNVAQLTGVAESGYRVVTNIRKDGGQSVDHLHYHVLGGRHMTWPPG